MSQLQSYVPYSDFTLEELRDPFWPSHMDKFLFKSYLHLENDFDLDQYKLMLLRACHDPHYKPTPEQIKSATKKGPEINILLYGSYVQQHFTRFDILFMVCVIAHESGKPVEEVDLFKRFNTDEFENDVTFSSSTMLGKPKYTIWLERKTGIYRDVICGEKKSIGYYEPMDKEFVKLVSGKGYGDQDAYAKEKAKLLMEHMVATVLIPKLFWKKDTGGGLRKGLDPHIVELAGIRFCNDDKDEDAKPTKSGGSEQDPAKKGGKEQVVEDSLSKRFKITGFH